MISKSLVKGIIASGAAVASIFAVSNPTSPFYSKLVMPIMRQMDPESAHVLAVKMASFGIVPKDKKQDDSNLVSYIYLQFSTTFFSFSLSLSLFFSFFITF